MRRQSLVRLALLTLSCSLAACGDGDDGAGGADAAANADAGASDGQDSDAAAQNVDNPNQPYTCDADTIALFRLNADDVTADSCGMPPTTLASDTAAITTVAGKHGEAYEAVNADDNLALYAATPIGNVLDTLTVEAWVRPPAVLPNNPLSYFIVSDSLANDPQARFHLRYEVEPGNQVLVAEIMDSSCAASNSLRGPQIADGDFHHVALVFDATAIRLFVDGTQADIQSRQANDTCDLVGTQLNIGSHDGEFPNPPEAFGHAIDEVRISSSAREFNFN